jgi:hypothetical protein
LTAKESSTLVDIDLVNGSQVRRVDDLPLLGDTWFAPDGRGIGVRRTAAIGQGPTLLRFITAEGRVSSESSVPDATSEIALGPDIWYVGCRNGLLYAFGFDGRQRWTWETPGARGYAENAYFRPCPYYVASQQSFAVVASMGNVHAVAPNGKSGTPRYQMSGKRVGNSQFRFRVIEETMSPTASLDFRSMRHEIR